MSHCEECGEHLMGLPFICKRCGGRFCTKHRLPENHHCPNLVKGNIFKSKLGSKPKRQEKPAGIKIYASSKRNQKKTNHHKQQKKHKQANEAQSEKKTPEKKEEKKETSKKQPQQAQPKKENKQKEPSKSKKTQEKKEQTSEKEPQKPKNYRKIVKFTIIILIILFLGYGFYNLATTPYIETINVTSNMEETQDIPKKNYENISLEEYASNVEEYRGESVSLKGMLTRIRIGDDTLRIIKNALIDDYNNTILITSLDEEERDLVPDEGATEKIYKVSGAFKRGYDGNIAIKVESITESQREFQETIIKEKINRTESTTQERVTNKTLLQNIITGFKKTLAGQLVFPLEPCEDGTKHHHCSLNKPYFCENGTLVNKSSKCGCPQEFRSVNDSCEKIQRCEDGTIYDECSTEKPLFCTEGELIEKASRCGCPREYKVKGEECISKYETNPKKRNFEAVVRGETTRIQFTVYKGLNDYLKGISRTITYMQGEAPPTDRNFIMRSLNNKKQEEYLNELVEKIKKKTTDEDEQVRIAVSLVQNIPYDHEGLSTGNIKGKYPYEVLYTNSGVCSEKAQLLAYLLRELGYGVAILRYGPENHDAVGIECPTRYQYKNTGYCFIESTSPTIMTDSQGDYIGAGKLTTTPQVITISDGKSLDSINEEYQDAAQWNRINSMGPVLEPRYYDQWQYLVEKYGIDIEG
ncbi:MAG: AN1-type zinc finger domain-containing protein [Candidatus Woesearchaeota archaeon]